MKTVYLIGAGAFGVRHLEGLLTARTPLSVSVIDPSPEALAKARVCSAKPGIHHISFVQEIPQGAADLAIVATTSGHREQAVCDLLAHVAISYLLLEKILFNRSAEYAEIGALLKKHSVRAWVNCPLRLMPLRKELRDTLAGERFDLHISGGARYGLMTNVMHYADYACYLAGSQDFPANTSLLDPRAIESKRAGYIELCGTVSLTFNNGSRALFTTLPQDTHGRRTVVSSNRVRAVLEEPANTAMVAEQKNNWQWEEKSAPILFQSKMTGPLAEEILETGECLLPSFEESSTLHLKILEPVRLFLEQNNIPTQAEYPFT